MWTRIVVIAALVVLGASPAASQKPASSGEDQKRLADLIAQGQGPYTRISDSAWSTPYRGKSMSSITVRIATAEGGIFFFVDLFDRKSITLSRNLLVKMAEMNAEFDYGKIALTGDAIQVRVDVRAKLLDAEQFRGMEKQAASIADEAYAVIKDFVQ
jgi:hypothetical protein